MLVGSDSQGIAAVFRWSPYANPGRVLIQLLAVDVRFRGQGGQCAQEALEVGITAMPEQARDAGAASLLMEAKIAVANVPSKRAFDAAGFVCDGPVEDAVGFERWARLDDL